MMLAASRGASGCRWLSLHWLLRTLSPGGGQQSSVLTCAGPLWGCSHLPNAPTPTTLAHLHHCSCGCPGKPRPLLLIHPGHFFCFGKGDEVEGECWVLLFQTWDCILALLNMKQTESPTLQYLPFYPDWLWLLPVCMFAGFVFFAVALFITKTLFSSNSWPQPELAVTKSFPSLAAPALGSWHRAVAGLGLQQP